MFMKVSLGRSLTFLVSPALSTLLWGQVPAPKSLVLARAETAQRSIPAGLENGLKIQTTAGAACLLRSENETDPNYYLQLDANEDGIV